MVIKVDTREKARVVAPILAGFERMGVQWLSHSLPFADYMSLDNPRLVIDRKHDLAEVCTNLSDVPKKDKQGRVKRYADGTVQSEWKRMERELSGAQQYGLRVIFLVEHGHDVQCLADVRKWVNPRLKESPMAMSGERLYRRMELLERKYGARWEFCDRKSTARRIVELLDRE